MQAVQWSGLPTFCCINLNQRLGPRILLDKETYLPDLIKFRNLNAENLLNKLEENLGEQKGELPKYISLNLCHALDIS